MTATDERPRQPARSASDRRRKEDQRLITGRTRWTDNITLPGMLHLAMVRSPFAHATITNIDTSAADGRPQRGRGLHRQRRRRRAGRAAQRLADHAGPGHPEPPADRRATGSPSPARSSPSSWPAAAAEARDAAELVDVEYDELPAALDLKEAAERRRGRRLAHPDLGTNKSALWVFDSAEAGTGGNVEDAIAEARTDGIVIEREYRQQRLIPAFMEPRSTVVDPTGEQITMWSATQIPHILRFLLAATTGVSESKIRVIAPDVGGGFGGKLQTTPEEWIACAVARRLGKPVQVHRDPLGVADVGPPRPRPVAEADPGGRPRTARSPGSRSTCSPTSAPTSRSSAAACRCWAPSCSTRSTSSRPTSSAARRC